MMITDDELDDLSDDDEIAFVQYEAIVRTSMERSRNSNNWEAERSYATHMIAFIQGRSIEFTYARPPGGDADFGEWFAGFLQAVDSVKVTLRLKHAARKKRHVSVLTLSLDFKTQIGGHLTAMRKIVFEADHLSESKRDALIRRINNLQHEVDRDRTRTEAAMALWLELTSAISKGATNLDPAIDRLERVVKVLSLSKDEAETKTITGPPKPKQLEPPKPPSDSETTEEDEIPSSGSAMF
jgi:hypothetical protein